MSSTIPLLLGDPAAYILRTYGLPPFQTEGDLLALAFEQDGTLWSVEEPGVLRSWDLAGQRPTGEALPLDEVATVWAFNWAGRLLAAASDELSVYEVASGVQLAGWPQPCWVTAVAFWPGTQMLATGHDDGLVRIWDWASRRLVRQMTGHQGPVSALAFGPDGRSLASASEDRTIGVWDAETGKRTGVLQGHTDRIPALAWHPDGKRLVSAGWDTTARVWDVARGEPIILLNSHAAQVHALAFTPDGSLLACADSSNAIHVWTLDGYREREVVREQGNEIRLLAFSPDGQTLVWGGSDREIHVWQAQQGQGLPFLADPSLARSTLTVSPDGRRLVSLAGGGDLRVWDTETTHSTGVAFQDAPALHTFAASPDGQWIAAGLKTPDQGKPPAVAPDGPPAAGLWQAATGQRQLWLEGQAGPVTALAFAPDSRLLASAGFQSSDVWLWQVPSGEPLVLLNGAVDGCSVGEVLFHPAGKLLAVSGIDWLSTSGADGEVAIWDVEERRPVQTFPGGATRLAFHPTGRLLAAASLRQTIRVWDLDTGKLACELKGHTEGVTALVYSPDGKWLVSGSDDRALRLWDSSSGEPRAILELDRPIRALAFSPDGRYIYTGSANTTCCQLLLQQLLTEEV
jgi:WD40 repeat protein